MLSTPHYEQSRDGYCLPACVRMVLAGIGQPISERRAAQLLGTRRFGTPISNITRLNDRTRTVQFGSLTWREMCEHVDTGVPVIAQVWPVMLTYWPHEPTGSHVVVVVGYDESYVYVNDPALPAGPQRMSHDAFLAAWAEHDETTAVIRRT